MHLGFNSRYGLYVQMVSQSLLALAGFLRDLRFPPAFKKWNIVLYVVLMFGPLCDLKGYPWYICLNKVINIIITFQIDVSKCHYLVDYESPKITKREPRYSELTDDWEVLVSLPFLDSQR